MQNVSAWLLLIKQPDNYISIEIYVRVVLVSGR